MIFIQTNHILNQNYPILQQLLLCSPLAIHQIEKIKTTTEMNFNSNPCIGNSDNPPTAPKITAKGAVHAGHPGVNAANAPYLFVVKTFDIN